MTNSYQGIILSIIIPCRNEVQYIRKTIDSLLNQEYDKAKYEIIIVDGMSDDGTREILKEYKSHYDIIYIVDNPKLITPVAFNIGIREAKGDIIAICGAHAFYSPDYISEGLKAFDKYTDASCLGGPILSVGENDFGKATALAMASKIGVGNANHRFPDYEGEAEMACFPFFKRKVFDEIGYYDETLVRNQDDEFCFRLKQNKGKVYVTPKIKSSYIVRSSPKRLFKQYFQYGFWRWIVFRKYQKAISMRHFIPSFFLIFLTLLFIISFLLNNYLIFLFLLLLYTGAITVVMITKCKSENTKVKTGFIWAVMILHFSYGTGLIYSILKNTIKRY